MSSMELLEEKVLKSAKDHQFQLLVGRPYDLKSYFINTIIARVAKKVIEINKNLYSASTEGSITTINIVDRTILTKIDVDELKILKRNEDGLLLLLTVIFKDNKAYIGDKLLIEDDLIKTLEKVFE